MSLIIAILMYIGVMAPGAEYSDPQIQEMVSSHQAEVNYYQEHNTVADDGTVTFDKTVWDHEQL